MSIEPQSQANGVAATDMEQKLTDLQALVRELLQERDRLRSENESLQQLVTILQEKVKAYAPIVKEWGKQIISPEEVERIMKENRWVSFEDVVQEMDKVLRSS
jgi:cell division FtsZ-interacting protein ZapD